MAKSTPSKPTSKTQQPAPLEGNTVWRERGRVRKTAPTMRSKSLWEKLPDWAQHALCLAFLFVVALSFFAPTTFGDLSIIGGDTVQWRSGAEAMIQYRKATGVEPLWAPNMFGGMPGYMVSYPHTVPGVDNLFGFLRGLGLWPVSHFLALLLGTYGLVFFLTRSKLAGTLAAVAYGLTTYLPIILTAGHNSKFIALAYAPWLLLAFAAILYRSDDSSWLRNAFLACLFAIVAAANLRAGHIQITYYVTFLAGVWWLTEGIAAARLGQLRWFAVSTSVLAAGAVLALAMVAQPYLAQWEYKAFTARGAGAGGGLAWDYAMAWSQGIAELFTLVVADFFGGAGRMVWQGTETGPLYWGPKTFTAGPHYVGPIVLLLALFGVFGVARRATTGLGVAALLMTFFALGEHLPLLNRPMFEVFPLFKSFRAPETWLAAVAFVLAVLAGYGAYWLQRREATAEAEKRKTRWLYGGLAGMALLLGLLWAAGPSLFEFARPEEAQQLTMQVAQQSRLGQNDPQVQTFVSEYLAEMHNQRIDVARADAGRSLLFLLFAAGLIVLYRREAIRPWIVLTGLVLLVTIDLWTVGRRHYSEEHPAVRRGELADAVQRFGYDDFILKRVDEAGGPGHFRVLSLSGNPTSDARPSFFYESVGGYHGAKLQLYQEYLDRLLFTGDTGINANALALMSTRYIVAPQPLPGIAAHLSG